MAALRKAFAELFLRGGLAGMLLCGAVAYAQEKRACGSVDYVGAEPNNPFTADRVTTDVGPNGQENESPIRELLARDEAGRVRIEKRATLSLSQNKTRTLTTRDGETFQVTQEDLNTHILIHDCKAGTDIQIEPGTRIAIIRKQWVPSQAAVTGKRPFSSAFTLGGRTTPELAVEDLGFREIQRIQARGERRTTMGIEKDGDWNGKPMRQWEQWVSDDLGTVMIFIQKDLITRKGSRWELIHIRRERSDPTLFEIPAGYKVNPKPAEIPFEFGTAKKPSP